MYDLYLLEKCVQLLNKSSSIIIMPSRGRQLTTALSARCVYLANDSKQTGANEQRVVTLIYVR